MAAGYDNLQSLREVFGDGQLFPDELIHTFDVDGVELVSDYQDGSTADRFYIVKHPDLVQEYLELSRRFAGSVIVELGIAEGGSTVLLALEARPRKLVAVDLEPQRLAALDELLTARGLTDAIRPHYGVDQADRTGLAQVVDGELGGEPIDLVIDDASHLLDPTRTSFETLFPRLRPGGLYVVEDWNGDLQMRDAMVRHFRTAGPEEQARIRESFRTAPKAAAEAPRRPLFDLAVELVLARASSSDAGIAEVAVSEYWVTVRRGDAELDPAGYRLTDHFEDHFGFLR